MLALASAIEPAPNVAAASAPPQVVAPAALAPIVRPAGRAALKLDCVSA
jgi:hypothetical protein